MWEIILTQAFYTGKHMASDNLHVELEYICRFKYPPKKKSWGSKAPQEFPGFTYANST